MLGIKGGAGRIESVGGFDLRVVVWVATALVMIKALLMATAAPAGETAYVLTEKGTNLGILYTSGKVDDLRFTVSLQEDKPTATYVWVTVGSNDRRVRTNEGYWLPFNGDPVNLIDNRFPIKDGTVTFKILDEDISADNHGVSISIGYLVGDTLKFGVFAVLPKVLGE